MSDHEERTGPDGRERLQRVLAARGVASRRAAEELIVAGRVTVNGRATVELGTKVDPVGDTIRVDGKLLRPQRPRYLMLNKPSGFITTVKDERSRWTVMDLVQVPERVYPVGRLDRATQGLVLLTNDGEVANRVMHPRYGMTKEYHVFAARRPSDAQLQRLRDGVDVVGRRVVPVECRLLREREDGVAIKLVLHEGHYHVVRRMMEIVGITVTRLRRFRIGPLQIVGLPSGAWRDLSPGELDQLFQALRLPAEAAARANERRTIQLTPVGGHHHGGAREGASVPAAGQSNAPPPGRRDDRARPAKKRRGAARHETQPGDRSRRRSQRGAPHGPAPAQRDRHGRPDRARPPVGGGDRRPRRGR